MSSGAFNAGYIIGQLIVWVGILGIYILPGIIASARRHRRRGWVWAGTILTGWLGVPWVAWLLWACLGRKEA